MSNFLTVKANPYEELYQRELTDIEVAEARSNLAGLYGLLLKIDKRIQNEQMNNLAKEVKNEQEHCKANS